jgi:hypothetical protein
MNIPSTSTTPAGQDWLGLRWSAWMPLMAAHPLALAQLPSAPGVYRVRQAGRPDELVWAGWAQGGIRAAVERLSRQVHMPLQPYDDPTGPALILWQARVRATAGFEVSGAPLDPATDQGKLVARAITQPIEYRPFPPSDE